MKRNLFKGHRAVLEIDDTAVDQGLLDLIVVTWVFVERRRRDK